MVENGATVLMEGVTLIFRNFSGEPDKYNPEGGKRTFGVLLPDDVAEAMKNDGWNVKFLKPREDDEDQYAQPWLPVAVRFDVRPPKIVMVTGENHENRTPLMESQVGQLDNADIANVDLIVRAYVYETTDKTGVKAYTQTMFVIVEEDELTKKYSQYGPR